MRCDGADSTEARFRVVCRKNPEANLMEDGIFLVDELLVR